MVYDCQIIKSVNYTYGFIHSMEVLEMYDFWILQIWIDFI